MFTNSRDSCLTKNCTGKIIIKIVLYKMEESFFLQYKNVGIVDKKYICRYAVVFCSVM